MISLMELLYFPKLMNQWWKKYLTYVVNTHISQSYEHARNPILSLCDMLLRKQKMEDASTFML